jgi:hypothetical protein
MHLFVDRRVIGSLHQIDAIDGILLVPIRLAGDSNGVSVARDVFPPPQIGCVFIKVIVTHL